ncbi:MAG: tRNA (adenosine(37)-N6)-threonylcarbamoyltransferase complex transferase subunit TsaD [Fimbriimonadales bacterium]|nr:tRNA (adenosine(37)-N6)-threonylcarbamoyltransferase complex transferase subunit TsaD [Fimbriimonadales bacterium]
MAVRLDDMEDVNRRLAYWEGPLLAIETSCDETSAAVLDGRSILSNVVSSQVDLHAQWGGIVPEAAARAHIETIGPVVDEAVRAARLEPGRITAVAATSRPGLVGALSVGLTYAKGLAHALRSPFLGVHHLEGHVLSSLACEPAPPFPHVCLVVSGGHTELIQVDAPFRYRLLGQTLDDAAGEAFDKGARLLGLGYPGGKAIEQVAEGGDAKRYPLPRGLSGETADFSFSGLKTALLRLVEREGSRLRIADAAASLQEAIVSVLSERAVQACVRQGLRHLTVVGGVDANRALRARLSVLGEREGVRVFVPDPSLCTDNAAMIGLAASLRLAAGERHGWDLDAQPQAELPGPPKPWDATIGTSV